MPLPPPGKTVWPPKRLEDAYRQYHINSTWYAGDPTALADLYDGQTGFDRIDTRYRASQFRGGLSGRLARMWWGTPPAEGELLAKLHLPLASDIAGMSAKMLFAEPPKITVGDARGQERIDYLLDDGGLKSKLIEGAEVGAALGDVYLVPAWDTGLRDHPWIRAVHGDAVVPEWRGDVLVAATVWRIVREDDNSAVWRHLERYEMQSGECVILHGLYKGDSTRLGDFRNLAEVDELSGLQETVPTGIDRLIIEHVPNLRPNRLDRSSPWPAS